MSQKSERAFKSDEAHREHLCDISKNPISSTDRRSNVNLDIFDGMEGMLTQAHIDKGLRDLCRECPVALCISDMLVEHKQEIGSVRFSPNRD